MSMGPGYSAHSGGLVNGLPRPGSAGGEVREPRESRRRERSHQRDREEGDDRDDEVISTIFVVGFPDDMSVSRSLVISVQADEKEREFQSIFTFAPGFEAAMLKFPSGSNRSREPTAALLAELSHIAAAQQAATAQALAAGEQPPDMTLPPPIEEALAALQLSTTSTSSATTPSAAYALTPSAQSGSTFGHNLPQLPTRRQTIGFARFRSRGDALAARDVLQGRRIDVMGGGTLKAEMAKKNLHTKRGHTQEELVGMLLRSGRLSGLVNGAAGTAQGGQGGQLPPRESWEQWQQQQAQQGQQGQQPGQPYDARDPTFYPSHNHSQPPQSNLPISPPQNVTSPSQRPTDSKALLALAEEADELEGWSAMSMGMTMEGLMPGHNRPINTVPYLASSSTHQEVNGVRDGNGMSGGVTGSSLPATTTNATQLPLSTSASSSLPLTSPPPTAAQLNADKEQSQSLPQGINMYRPHSNSLNGYYGNGNGGGGDYAGSPPGDSLDGRLAGPNPADQNPPVSPPTPLTFQFGAWTAIR